MARSSSTAEIAEIAALRKECANLRSTLATEACRLEGAADTAKEECAEHRKELARLRASGPVTLEASSPESSPLLAPAPQSSDLVEAMHELEHLEHALVEERRRTAQLLEEKRAAEESHARDVEMLERMLQQVLGQNEELSAQVAAWENAKLRDAQVAEVAVVATEANDMQGILSQQPNCPSPARAKAGDTDVDEPEMEPRRVCLSSLQTTPRQ